jgi:hypothetical protein
MRRKSEHHFEGEKISRSRTSAPEKQEPERGQKAERPAHSASQKRWAVQKTGLVCRFVTHGYEFDAIGWRHTG